MRPQTYANLVIPYLQGMIPETAAPCWRVGNFINVVDQDVDFANLVVDSPEQRLYLPVMTMVTLNRPAITALVLNLPGSRIN